MKTKTFNGNIQNMTQEDWENNRALGEWAEKVIIENFTSTGKYELLEHLLGNDDYDFRLLNIETGREITFEVKMNIWMIRNGSKISGHRTPFIETFSYGKISGISVCKADYWITYYPLENNFYCIKLEDLKNNLIYGRRSKGGNKGYAKGYLLDRKYIGKNKTTTKPFYQYNDSLCSAGVEWLKDWYDNNTNKINEWNITLKY